MKFRVAHKEELGYFAHVKFWFFGSWYRISKHQIPGSMHIYFYDLYNYPLETQQEVDELINKFKEYRAKKLSKATFKEIK